MLSNYTTELSHKQQQPSNASSPAPADPPKITHPGRVRLEFHNISYDVYKQVGSRFTFWKSHKEKKRILDDISGVVEPGDLVALMGTSGAGKSTLLNVLSRRIISHKGEVSLNGIPADKSPIMKASTCYIQQEDLFFGFITVTEHLEQQARLRIPLPQHQRQERIRDVMDRFSLNKSRSSLIGNIAQGARRGISGGEKKRLSVATELLINPALIFADEPTSGLDAFMAASVVEALKALADSGHTVVTTIHQPSSDVFALFTKLLLLSEGRVIFYGPRLAAIAYFLRLGFPCPPYTNPADHFIELISIDWENPTAKLEELDRWHATWKRCSQAFLHEWETGLAEKFTASLAGNDYPIEAPPLGLTHSATAMCEEKPFEFPLDSRGNPKRPPLTTVASTLLKRCVISITRNPSVVRARLIQTIVTAFLGGLVYFRLAETAAHSKAGACFFILVNLGFMMTFTAVTTFMADKTIVLRERDTGLYGLATYFWAKIVSDMLLQFYLPILYACICWYLMGLNDMFWRFIVGSCYILLMSLSVASIGYIVASFSQHLGVAVALGPVLLLPFLMVSGFVIQKSSLPRFWIWLYHLSPFVYGYSGLMRATFLDVEFKNAPPVPPVPSAETAVTFYSGNQVLENFSIATNSQRWLVDVCALFLWMVLGRFVAMVLFLWANRHRKN